MYDLVAGEIAASLEALTPETPFGDPQGAIAAFRRIGFSGATFFKVGRPHRGLRPLPVFGRPVPAAWTDHYAQARQLRQDIFTAQIIRSGEAFTWADMEAHSPTVVVRDFLAVCRQFTAELLVCPVLAASGDIACVTLWMDEARPVGVAERHLAHSFATYFALVGQGRLRINRPPVAMRDVPTVRELECLYWVAQGKTDAEIADLLKLSASTVHHHVERAKRRLQARSRTELIRRAADEGVILLPDSL